MPRLLAAINTTTFPDPDTRGVTVHGTEDGLSWCARIAECVAGCCLASCRTTSAPNHCHVRVGPM